MSKQIPVAVVGMDVSRPFKYVIVPDSLVTQWTRADEVKTVILLKDLPVNTPLYAAPPQTMSDDEIEALRADAERYRWLRRRVWFQCEFDTRYGDSGKTLLEFDAGIDAAMKRYAT